MQSADAVVVGGGIVGCMCAFYLARAGLRVTLVERHAIAGGTSGSCMGHLMVVPKPSLLSRMTFDSVRLWHELSAEIGDFEHNPCGALWLAEDENDLPLLDLLREVFGGYDPGARSLDRAELRELEPGLADDLIAGFHFPPDGIVLPMRAAGAVLRDAVARGARVLTGTAVREVRRGRSGAVEAVVTDQGDIATETVVDAAGVWAPEIAASLGLSVPIRPRRGDLAITLPREAPVRHQLLEVGYLRTTKGSGAPPVDGEDPGAHALNVQPQSHGTCLIGSTRQFAGAGRDVDRGLLDKSLQRAVRFVPALAGARLTRTWAGLRPFTADGLPIVGPVPEVPGFYMAAGHEGLGITLAPITGQLIAQAVVGEETRMPLEPLSLGRFGAEVGNG